MKTVFTIWGVWLFILAMPIAANLSTSSTLTNDTSKVVENKQPTFTTEQNTRYFIKMEKYCSERAELSPVRASEWIELSIRCRENLIRLQETKNGD